MSYFRVIPRDLFNEAKLLKCLGKLSLLHVDRMLPEGFEVALDYDNRPFGVEQDPASGSLLAANVLVTWNGERVHCYTTLNNKNAWPLFFETEAGECDKVFTEDGELSDEFKAAFPDRVTL